MKTLNISSLELAREVLSHQSFEQALYDDGADAMSDVILTMHGEEYALRRELNLAYFSGPSVKTFLKKELPSYVSQAIEYCRDQDVNDAVTFARYFSTCMGARIIGINVDFADQQSIQSLSSLSARFVEGATIVHTTRNKEEIKSEVERAFEEFDEKFYGPSRRWLKSKGVDWHDCILQRYLDRQQQLKLQDKQLMRETAFFLHAASAPTSRAIVNALHEILMWVGSDLKRRRDLLSSDSMLRNAVLESLRLNPASPVAWRRAIEPVKLSNGEWLEQGDYAIIDVMQVNTDRFRYGDDARQFDPARSVDNEANAVGLTLGHGLHACPARNMLLGSDAGLSGILPSVIAPVLRMGVRQDENNPAKFDRRTERVQWQSYPMIFDPKLAI